MMRAHWITFVFACSSPPPVPTRPTPTVTPDAAPASTMTPTVKGYAYMPGQPMSVLAIDGTITRLEATGPSNDQLHWKLVVEDGKGAKAEYLIDLPDKLNMPVMQGEHVILEADVVGGGPNATGRIAILDGNGYLRLAINRAPAPWRVERGGKDGPLDKGDAYDEQSYFVKLTPPLGAAVEVAPAWQIVTLGGHRFHANGHAAVRQLTAKYAPPDYVESWIDFALIAIDEGR